jgi:thymidylate synthase
MNNLDKQYTDLLQDILEHGTRKMDRTGTGTISVFGRQIRHKMSEGFPAITTKKMAFKTMVTELLWFLRGDTNIKFLVDNNCHIWDGDAYKNYLFNSDWFPISSVNGGFIGTKTDSDEIMTQELFIDKIKTDAEFAKKWGELGPVYGKQWRNWAKFNEKVYTKQVREVPEGGRFAETRNVNWVGGSEVVYIDQIANLINDIKTNPDSRRLLVSAWNPADLPNQVLPPCHYGFQVYTRELSLEERVEIYGVEKIQTNNAGWYECSLAELDVNQANIPKRAISLMFNMRSTDVGLGLSFNLSSYGLLLMMIAKQVNMVPDELIYNGGDVHLYLNHIEPIKEQLTREPYPLPTVKISDRVVNDISEYTLDDITLENYQSHPKIYFPLSN